MKPNSKKRLIISLIGDDIINTCLVNRLNKAGLDAGDYFLSLSDTIFGLIGFPDNLKTESVYEKYLKLLKQATPRQIKEDREKVNKLAAEIYRFLIQNRKRIGR